MQKQIYSLENIEFFRKQAFDEIKFFEQDSFKADERLKILSSEVIQLGEAKKLLIQLKNSKMFDKKDFILNTINTALSDVFTDQEVKIDLVASNTNQEASKLNIKYDIVLYQKGLEIARNEKLLLSNGGGVISFISILFKILVGYIYSRNKLFIFDESLAQVSEIYRPRLAQFLQKFCLVHGFNIIIITQTSDIAEFSDLVYYLDGDFEDGIPILKIDKIVGDYPEENYVYTKIENFQSIKKLEFRYKGFTAIIGKNNIGKSASFRAVNSILFNNFDMKLYPRMASAEKPDKQLNSRIEFGRFYTKDDPRNDASKIALYKKGQSIIWEFNGNEFVGKNLAFEKVKEKVEEIGFKYLRLKDQYKNFKGNLKDQTERLAITTQHDGLYLIGNKTSDTAKVFDFLFDSREVTLALIDLNNDVLVKEQEINQLTLNIANNTNAIKVKYVEIKKWEILYKKVLIESYINATLDLAYLQNEAGSTEKLVKVVNKALDLAIDLWRIVNCLNEVELKEYRKDILQKSIIKYDQLISNHIKIIQISELIETNRKYNLSKAYLNRAEHYHKISILQLYILNVSVWENLKFKFGVLHRLKDTLTKCLDILNKKIILEQYFYCNDIVTTKRYSYSLKEKMVNIINVLLENYRRSNDLFYIINQKIEISKLYQRLQNGILYNTKVVSLYNIEITKANIQSFIYNIQVENQKVATKQNQIQLMHQTILNLPNQFGLVPCKECSTLGFTCYSH